MSSSPTNLFIHTNKIKVITVLTMFFCSALLQSVYAQVVCPDDSVSSTTLNQFAYQAMESASATCVNNLIIPTNGVRVFSSGRDCEDGNGNGTPTNGGGSFIFVAENGGGFLPSLLTCDNCSVIGGRDVLLAPATMANVTARFVLSGGTVPVVYRAQISRTALDVNGDSTCSITSASITGGAFGGDAIQPTVNVGALIFQPDGTYTSNITLSEPSTDFISTDLTLVNATATLIGSGTAYVATLTPTSNAQISLSVAAAAFIDAANNDNLASNQVTAVPMPLVVLNNNDSGPDSLRDVVAKAVAGVTIIFDPGLAGQTITLTSGDIDLTKDVTIDGSALSSQVAISGNSSSRVFNISNNRSVTLNALTLQDGSAVVGGLINGTNGVTLDISDSTFQRGVANVEGGAIRVIGSSASTIIRRSLFTENTSASFGAAISNNAGNLSVINTTLTNNTGNASVSIIFTTRGVGSITNSSVVDNTGIGIIYRSIIGDFHLSNTVISGNSRNGVRLIDSATLTTNINNLCDNCSSITTTVQQDALVAPLADNGGPTLTHALYSNSPALNMGDNAAAASLTTDQRGTGFSRVLAGTVDIGAFEGSVPVPVRAVNLSASANTGSEAAGTVITLTATADAPVVGDQSVNIGVSGTGVTASDYILSNASISIVNGETTGTVTFTVQDDTLLEGNEMAILSISNPSAGLSLGTTTSQNISIIDSLTAPAIPVVTHGPPTICAGNVALLTWSGSLNSAAQWVVYTDSCGGTQIDLTTSNSSIVNPPANATSISYFIRGEGGSVVTPGMCGVHAVPITPREDASFSYPATTYLTTDADPTPTITGVSGGAFSSSAGTGSNVLSINSATGTIDLSATPPGDYTIEYETPGLCGATTTQMVTIAIPASPVILQASTNTGTEAATSVITLTALSESFVSGDQTVDISVTGADITPSDYVLSNTTITIPNGQLSGSVTFNVQDDTLIEGPETAVLTLSNPSAGLFLFGTVSQDITITDNDFPGISYGGAGFTEYMANDGSVSGEITATLDGDRFTDPLILNTGITLGNVPAGLTPVIEVQDSSDSWVTRLTSNRSFTSVTYGNGQFVAVTDAGINRVMTSVDGINWTAHSAPQRAWRSVTYGDDGNGNGLFVAVAEGSNQVMTSPDGIAWTARSAPLNFWASVTYGEDSSGTGLFVAVADLGTNQVMTSPDGINWTARNTPLNFWRSVTYGDLGNGTGLFVAVGNGNGTLQVMSSPDGITWTARSTPFSIPHIWRSVAYGDGLFVAVAIAGTNRVMTSPDGITWTAQSAPLGVWSSVTYGNDLFVAVRDFASNGNRVMTSPDGSTWTSQNTPQGEWQSVAFGHGRFAAVSSDGNIMSTDLSMARLTLSGNANSHLDADDVADITFNFADSAFINSNAADVTDATGPVSSNLGVDFNDPVTHTVGGTISGLVGTGLVLQNNVGDDLSVNANGNFTFATALTDGSAYAVTVLTQPASPNQVCSVANGSGTLVGNDVVNVTVTCSTDTHTIAGTVTGLEAGNSVVLQNNSSDNLTVSADGGFTFDKALADGSAYAVTVLTQPTTPTQTCTVAGGTGTVAGSDVTDVVVTCATDTYTVGGTISGLAVTSSVTLQNNGADDLVINTNGSFTFSAALADGSNYDVTVLSQILRSSNLACVVSNGSGTLTGGDVSDVTVTCTVQASSIQISNASIDFGAVTTNASTTETLTISNIGTADLNLSAISSPASPFSIVSGSCLSLPVVLVPYARCELEVMFAPDVLGAFNAVIDLTSDADSSPDQVSLTGSGSAAGSGAPVSVPTLSGWMLMLLSVLIIGAGVRQKRRQFNTGI